MTAPRTATPRRRHTCRGLVFVVMATVAALGPSSLGAASAPVFAQSAAAGLDAARARVDAASEARVAATVRLDEARLVAEEVAAAVGDLTGRRQDVVDQMGRAQQQASQLAVDAYMRGGSVDELRLFDAEQSTRTALRLHLTSGRIGQAREAAAQLLSLRQGADDELGGLADSLARASQAVADAERDLAEAIGAELYADALLGDAEAAAAAEREAELTARRAREAAAAAAAAAEAEAEAGDDGAAGSAGDAPPARAPAATQPAPTPYVVDVPVHTDPWEQLRQCESGGNYQSKSNPLYRGAYQFGWSTWESVGGTGDPADAPPAEQDARAYALYLLRGWSPWPTCGAGLAPG